MTRPSSLKPLVRPMKRMKKSFSSRLSRLIRLNLRWPVQSSERRVAKAVSVRKRFGGISSLG